MSEMFQHSQKGKTCILSSLTLLRQSLSAVASEFVRPWWWKSDNEMPSFEEGVGFYSASGDGFPAETLPTLASAASITYLGSLELNPRYYQLMTNLCIVPKYPFFRDYFFQRQRRKSTFYKTVLPCEAKRESGRCSPL